MLRRLALRREAAQLTPPPEARADERRDVEASGGVVQALGEKVEAGGGEAGGGQPLAKQVLHLTRARAQHSAPAEGGLGQSHGESEAPKRKVTDGGEVRYSQ